jgi:hypothetical protein
MHAQLYGAETSSIKGYPQPFAQLVPLIGPDLLAFTFNDYLKLDIASDKASPLTLFNDVVSQFGLRGLGELFGGLQIVLGGGKDGFNATGAAFQLGLADATGGQIDPFTSQDTRRQLHDLVVNDPKGFDQNVVPKFDEIEKQLAPENVGALEKLVQSVLAEFAPPLPAPVTEAPAKPPPPAIGVDGPPPMVPPPGDAPEPPGVPAPMVPPAPLVPIGSPLALSYSVTQLASGLFEYAFDLVLDNHSGSWQAGQDFNWITWGDVPGVFQNGSMGAVSPLADFALVGGAPAPFTGMTSSGGGHNGPTFLGFDAESNLHGWVPDAVGDALHWVGDSSADVETGLLWSTLEGTGLGANFVEASNVSAK